MGIIRGTVVNEDQRGGAARRRSIGQWHSMAHGSDGNSTRIDAVRPRGFMERLESIVGLIAQRQV